MTWSRSRLRPYLWTRGLLWLLPAALVGGAWLVLPRALPPGQCEGIGFGCTLSPADSALVLGVVAAPMLLTVGVVVVVVAIVRGVRRRRDTTAGAPVWTASTIHDHGPCRVLQCDRAVPHDEGQ